MRARRIGIFLALILDVWALLYSGKTVYYYIFLLIMTLFAISGIQLLLSFLSFRLRINLSSRTVEKKQPFTLKLLAKAKHLPVAYARISIRMPDFSKKNKQESEFLVSPGYGKTVVLPVDIEFPYAGKYPLTISATDIFDIFGLWRLPVRPAHYLAENPVTITVLPDTTYFLPYEQLYDDIVLPIRKTRERAEAVGVREYGRGDDMRSMHWKYSARVGKLHVKEYEKGARELHLIYLDLTDTQLKGEDDAACKDLLLCSAASLCRTLLREQVPMMILGYSKKDSGRFSLTRPSRWDEARIYLAQRDFFSEIPAGYKETIANYVLREKSTLTIFSMSVTSESLSFLTYRAADYSSVSLCLVPQEGFKADQQSLVHYFSDRGIRTVLLHAKEAPAEEVSAV